MCQIFEPRCISKIHAVQLHTILVSASIVFVASDRYIDAILWLTICRLLALNAKQRRWTILSTRYIRLSRPCPVSKWIIIRVCFRRLLNFHRSCFFSHHVWMTKIPTAVHESPLKPRPFVSYWLLHTVQVGEGAMCWLLTTICVFVRLWTAYVKKL